MVTRPNIGAPQAPTITIPLAGITVMVWIDSPDDVIAAATGMERGAFLDLLKLMEADLEHKRHVFSVSRKRRGVETDRLLAFLRDRFTGQRAAQERTEDEPVDPVDAVLEEVGAAPVKASPKARKAVRK
jgi:hypothetical protein